MNDAASPTGGRPAPSPPAGYHERLWPSAGVWLAALGLAAGCGLVTLPFSTFGAVLTGLIVAVVLLALMIMGTAAVAVRDGMLAAGRARAPLTALGAVQELDPAAMRAARGRELDARAYLCLRGWLSSGVRVEITDPADPTPYWLVSSRNPGALAAALQAGSVSRS
jgi:hypothetical protein